ncbi:MAG: hypothetical protein H0V81_04100 [Solirubrobacterales bacterium]|nr:hypothetical protein [Solirubrobacterales bacterium]
MSARRARAPVGLALILVLLLGTGSAAAQSAGSAAAPPATGATGTTKADPNKVVPVTDLDAPQAGYALTGRQVLDIAAKDPTAREVVREVKGAYPGAYTKGPGRWQVSYFSRDKPPKEVAQLYLSDGTRKVTEAYTGYKVAWTMARGYAGAFGKKVNSPWVWIPLTVLFLLPFVRVRGVRFDLAVLAAFGISVAYFNDAQVDTSVPLVYPLLAYLLVRALWLGLRRAEAPREPLKLLVPPFVLLVGVLFLLGFRVGLNVTSSNVIDVGYAGVIGADKLASAEPIYGTFPSDNEHGDTYGPVNYGAYLPFVQAFGWSGTWDGDLPAAHAAAIAFDLLACGLLFLLGRRMRGPTLGIVLAYLWVAFPFSLYALMSNSNDALVAVFVVLALLVASGPKRRGAAVALGGLTKFATLALAPLFATHGYARTRLRGVIAFSVAFALVALVALAPVIAQGESFSTVYDRTLGFQASRGSPFSLWGLYDLPVAQSVWQGLSVLLALVLAVVPRRRDVVGLAGCAAAIVIALQVGVTLWFYLYIVWFFPLLAVALFARYAEPAPRGPALPQDVVGTPSQGRSSGSIALA